MSRLCVLSVILAALAGAACEQASDELSIFDAALSPQNEVPPRASGASGTAGLTFDGTTVSYSLVVSNITGVTQSHIHSGAAEVNGPVRVFLYGGPTTGAADGILAEGSFTAADVSGIDFNQLLDEMRNGTAYVNVHTEQYPAGEIRGQVRLLN